MSNVPTIRRADRRTNPSRQGGQSMVEYTVVLAWVMLVSVGAISLWEEDLRAVVQNNYGGYSYAMSLSTLPDFGSGPDLEAYIQDLNLDPPMDDQTLERLTVDPIDAPLSTALEGLATAHSAFNDIRDLLNNLEDLDDLAAQMLEDAISPF